MQLRLIMAGVLTFAATSSFTVQSWAQTSDGSGISPIGGASPRVAARRINSTLLVNIDETAKSLGWVSKLVTPGKLLTLCRDGDEGVCIPIRLDRVVFQAVSNGMYVEAATVERALQIEFKDEDDDTVAFAPAMGKANGDDETPAYNADWGSGRGFRVGQTLPDIPLIDLEGREVRFSEFLGKRCIIYCWASW